MGAPADPQTNDVWIAVISSRDQVAHTFTDWTEIDQDTFDGQSLTTSVWEFRYAGSPPNLVLGPTDGANIVGSLFRESRPMIQHSFLTPPFY